MAHSAPEMTNRGIDMDRFAFKGFEKIGAQVYVHRPGGVQDGLDSGSIPSRSNSNERKSTGTTRPPDLIILCTWMAAAPKHIAKYTSAYTDKFPDSSILLLRSSLDDMTWRTVASQVDRVGNAVDEIRALAEKGRGQKPRLRVLLHVFSNGGTWTACMLARAYARVGASSAHHSTTYVLPVSAIVIDSAPSLPHARLGYNAMSQALGKSILIKILGGILIWSLIVITWALNRLRLQTNKLLELRRIFNDPSGPFLRVDVPRVYICSMTDAMVPIEDVLSHAGQARNLLDKQGMDVAKDFVRVEEFQRSTHCGHLMVDPISYWRVVDETWGMVSS